MTKYIKGGFEKYETCWMRIIDFNKKSIKEALLYPFNTIIIFFAIFVIGVFYPIIYFIVRKKEKQEWLTIGIYGLH